MRSISAGRLIVDGARAASRRHRSACRSAGADRRISAVIASIGARAVDPLDDARPLVVIDHLEHRRHLAIEARAHDLGLIVVALDELASPSLSQMPGYARRVGGLVVRGAAGRADPAAAHPADDDRRSGPRCRSRDRPRSPRRRGSRRAPSPEPRVRGKPSRIAPRAACGFASSSMNMPIVISSGTSSPRCMYVLRLLADRRAGRHRGAEQVARGEVREPKLTREEPSPGCPCPVPTAPTRSRIRRSSPAGSRPAVTSVI